MFAGLFAKLAAHKDIADLALKGSALVVGAAWTLLQYWRTHPNRHKPEVGVEGRLLRRNGEVYLTIHCSMKNLGQREYLIDKRGTGLRIWRLSQESLQANALPFAFQILEVFTEHNQMEAGTTIHDNKAVAIPQKTESVVLYRVQLRVRVSGNISLRRRICRRLFLTLLTKNLKRAMGDSFEASYPKAEQQFGKKFRDIFSFKFDELFKGTTSRKPEFRKVVNKDLGEILGPFAGLKAGFLRVLWALSSVDFTIFRTNCLIESTVEPMAAENVLTSVAASLPPPKEDADADAPVPATSRMAAGTAAV